MFAFTLLVQKRVSEAQKRVDNARFFDSALYRLTSTFAMVFGCYKDSIT